MRYISVCVCVCVNKIGNEVVCHTRVFYPLGKYDKYFIYFVGGFGAGTRREVIATIRRDMFYNIARKYAARSVRSVVKR